MKIPRYLNSLLALDAFPNCPFASEPPIKPLDPFIRLVEVTCSRMLRHNPPPPPWRRRYVSSWQTFSNLERPHTRNDEELLGIVSVWDEEDIIYATVRNLFIQGVSKVFVIDDDSDDSTVAEATAAGATIVKYQSDGVYSELRRSERIRKLINDQTSLAGRPLWWIVADADEFPRGPNGLTVREFLSTIPSDVEVVGSRVLEHYPDCSSVIEARHHPIDQLVNARWYRNPYCAALHWKHQLMRVEKPDQPYMLPGQHTIAYGESDRPVIESRQAILMDHFPLRNRARTEAKLRLAAEGRYANSPDSFTKWRLKSRLRMLELVYSERYDIIPNSFPAELKTGIDVYHWHELVAPRERILHHEVGSPL
jgi:hypothetical protein